MCEIKPAFEGGKMRETLDHNRELFRQPILGVSWEEQRKLLDKVGHQHYMGVQLLASLFKGWSFLCFGGSSNLFSLLPARVIHLSDTHCKPHYDLLRKLAVARWGENLGNLCPAFDNIILENLQDFAERVNTFTEKSTIEVE